MAHGIPELPWEKIGADIFHYNKMNFLILVDYYSRFFEVNLLQSLRASDLIVHMKSQFARHGIPKEVVSDNGPQFGCQEFINFTKRWGFRHITSSPIYPQSNGMAERAIQTIKCLLKKADVAGQDPYIALLQLRNAPCADGPSPARLLMGRRLRSNLPVTDAYLKPHVPDQKEMANTWNRRKYNQGRYYNKAAKMTDRPRLQPGDSVYLQQRPKGSWRPAVVVSEASTPRSYMVKTPGGKIYRRNRRMLRETFGDRRGEQDLFEMDTPGEIDEKQSDKPDTENDSLPGSSTSIPQPVVTRYGRQVKPPIRFGDYEMY